MTVDCIPSSGARPIWIAAGADSLHPQRARRVPHRAQLTTDVPIRRGMHVLTTALLLPHRYRVEPAKKIGATVQVAEGPLATALVAEADALAFLARVDPSLLIWELTAPPKPTGAIPGASAVLTRTRLRRRLASLGKAWPHVPESAAEAAAAEAAAKGNGAVNDDDDDGNSVRLVVNDQLQALLPLADLVDADKERQRLGKQKGALEASIATVSVRVPSSTAAGRKPSSFERYASHRSWVLSRPPPGPAPRWTPSAMARISESPVSWPTGLAPAAQTLKPLYCAGLWLAVVWMPPAAPRWFTAK